MSLVISNALVRASGLSKRELLLEIVLMLFRQDKRGYIYALVFL
jgi:predicted HTH domain antitoxin